MSKRSKSDIAERINNATTDLLRYRHSDPERITETKLDVIAQLLRRGPEEAAHLVAAWSGHARGLAGLIEECARAVGIAAEAREWQKAGPDARRGRRPNPLTLADLWRHVAPSKKGRPKTQPDEHLIRLERAIAVERSLDGVTRREALRRILPRFFPRKKRQNDAKYQGEMALKMTEIEKILVAFRKRTGAPLRKKARQATKPRFDSAPLLDALIRQGISRPAHQPAANNSLRNKSQKAKKI